MLLFVLASVYFLMILAHFTALPDVWKAGVVERWRPVVIFFLVGSLALAIGRGLFRAQTYAVRAAPVFSAVVGLGLLYIFLDAWWTQGRETTFAKIVFSGLVASNAFIVLAVLSQATRRWHREAIDIRADQLPRPASSRWSRLLTGLGRGRVPASPPPARDASPGVSPG